MITSREKRAWRKRPRNAGYYNNIRDGHVLLVNSMQTADIFHFLTESIVHTRIACMAILCIRPAKLPTPLIIDRLVQWVGFVASRWRRRGVPHEAARGRWDITYFIVHRNVHHSDGPSWPEQSSPKASDTWRSTLTPKSVKPSNINILISPVIPTTS